MAAVSQYMGKALLDWSLGGATPTRPTAGSQAVGLSQGVPTSVSGSEVGTGSGWTRQIPAFAAAGTPAGTAATAANGSAMTFGPGLTQLTASGIQVWDTVAATTGNMLWFGVLATPRTLLVGDSLVFAVGSLLATIT